VSPRRRLTAKQRRFVEEFPVDWNATQAAIRAGYSPKTAKQIGHENLTKPAIALAIFERARELAKRADVEATATLRELERVGLANLRDAVEWGPDGVRIRPSEELEPDVAAAVAEVSETVSASGSTTRRVRMHSKGKALEVLVRYVAGHEGMISMEAFNRVTEQMGIAVARATSAMADGLSGGVGSSNQSGS